MLRLWNFRWKWILKEVIINGVGSINRVVVGSSNRIEVVRYSYGFVRKYVYMNLYCNIKIIFWVLVLFFLII